jgi:hypothetical protein
MLADSTDVVFSVNVTNFSESNVSISINTFMLVVVPQLDGTGESELYMYIVHPDSTSDNLIAYPSDYSQVIQAGESAVLKFAARQPGGDTFLPTSPPPLTGYQGNSIFEENLLTSFIVLFWRDDSSPTQDVFGTTVALGAIHVLPAS